MKLDDGKPWFRRWLVIGFWPVTSEGKFLIEIMAGVGLLAGFLILMLADHPFWPALIAAVSFVIIVAGYVIIHWKREDPF